MKSDYELFKQYEKTSNLDEIKKGAKSGNLVIRNGVAANPNTPPEILAGLASDQKVGLRLSVARHRNTPPKTLAQLAKDAELCVQLVAIKHPKLHWTDKWELAKDPSTKEEVLEKLADDPETTGRVIENPSTPLWLLERLSLDYKGNPVHRREAFKKWERRIFCPHWRN